MVLTEYYLQMLKKKLLYNKLNFKKNIRTLNIYFKFIY